MIDNYRDLSKKELLDSAERRIFSLGLRDLASALSYRNMCYGLAKILYTLDDEAYCIFAPDATITRNKGRWLSGFGYGGIIRWFDKSVAFPEIRPNACGMLLASLEELPSKEKLIQRASEIGEKELMLNDTRIEPDFGKGNHFFEIYKPLEISEDVSDKLPRDNYFAVLHGSAPELKDLTYSWVEKSEDIETPFGSFSVLYDNEAERYYEDWKNLESFSKKRREIVMEEVLGSHKVVSNITHQGLFAKNEARLGCYDAASDELFPVALRWDYPTYIFKGKPNLSENVIDRLDFKERAEELRMLNGLKQANILPHGGGYKIMLPYGEIGAIETSFGNVFTLSDVEPAKRVGEVYEEKAISEYGEMIITDPKSLPYTYRGKRVIGKTTELELGDVEAKLRPIMTLKI